MRAKVTTEQGDETFEGENVSIQHMPDRLVIFVDSRTTLMIPWERIVAVAIER